MYLIKTPNFIKKLFPNYFWNIDTTEKVLYITFDDGPIPEVTPQVLNILDQYNAKATFFCVGSNVKKYDSVFNQVIDAGHTIGNHTFTHKDGWQTDRISYFHDVRHCARLVNSDLFRPPYGRLKMKQAQFLQRHYKIVMWDVLSGDFDPNISTEKCYKNVINNATNGSIIVFHDSLKAEQKVLNVLPRVLEYFASLGYRFEAIDGKLLRNKNRLKKTNF